MIFVLLFDLFTGWWNRLLQRKGQCECAVFLLPICSPSILAPANTGHTQTWASNMVLLHSALSLSLVLSFTSFPSFSFSYSPHSCLMFSASRFFVIALAYYCSPSLFCLFPGLFFPCSFLSVIPPPSLSQVKRFLPCFSSNWQMRCMSWLHCCFIRKQLFTLSLPPPSCFFPLSPPPSLPCILSSISHHAFLHISPCL